jgi:hypothetical protein
MAFMSRSDRTLTASIIFDSAVVWRVNACLTFLLLLRPGDECPCYISANGFSE